MAEATRITTPVGRLVGGSLYKPQDKDATGKPLTIKSGPDTGKPTVRFWIPVAVPKGAEAHWNQTQWGAAIWAVGARAFPQAHQSPQFAWKVVDGDSRVPNTKGKYAAQNEGYPGHWVLNFGGKFPPKAVNAQGTEVHHEPDYIKPGYYVQVGGSVSGNNEPTKPGVYLNYDFVALSGFGTEIQFGAGAGEYGFGQAPLPPGASATPVSSLPATPAQVAMAATVGYTPPPPVAQAPVTQVAVAPDPAILMPPPPPPVVPAGPVMTAKAAGVPYASFIAQGWTDATLRANGYLV